MLKALWLSLWPDKIINAEGLSNSTGFEVKFTDSVNRSRLFYTRSYNPEHKEDKISKPDLKKIRVLFWVLSLPYAVLCVWSFGNLLRVAIMSAIGAFGFSFIATFLITVWEFRKATEVREWHACEHKSIMLLELGLSPTSENLRGMPSVSVHCGTSQLGIMFLEAPIFILLFLWSDVYSAQWREPILLILSLGFWWMSACAGLVLLSFVADFFSSTKFHYTNLVIALSFSPLAIIPCIIEKLCVLKEPSEKKISATVEDLRKLIEEHNLYKID
ncbi:MAG: DUF1385 domain-containing protein [bacterium]|nr:DUF1385 domain-containing protein [bacterium]